MGAAGCQGAQTQGAAALQFKGIAVEGFHNTPDWDAKGSGGGKALGARRPS